MTYELVGETPVGEPLVGVSRRIAPEDLKRGEYIAVACIVHYYYLPSEVAEARWARPEPIPFPCIDCASGEALKVVAVCLPFVLALDCDGDKRTLDVRCHRLVRLSEEYGREAFKPKETKEPAKETPPAPAPETGS